jgi:sugar lactone lactonase YvrE
MPKISGVMAKYETGIAWGGSESVRYSVRASLRKLILSVGICLVLAATSMAPVSHAYLVNSESASVVIGEPNFSAYDYQCYNVAPTQSSQCFTGGIAFDKKGNLWVADSLNDRVLEYKPPFVIGEPASLVLGQPTFNTNINNDPCYSGPACMLSPTGLAFDKSGNLWVSDGSDNRILRFDHPFTNGEEASLVIGQPDFLTITEKTTGAGLWGPGGIAFDKSGNLWVADSDNNRVLRYTSPFSTGQAASLVIGQSDFTSNGCVVSPPTSQGFCTPSVVNFDSSGNLWVSDVQNQRVLRFNSPFSTHEAASLVLGWPDFSSRDPTDFCPGTPTLSQPLCGPEGILFDSAGNVWVADDTYGRALRFDVPFSNGEAPSMIIGQADFTSQSCPQAGPSCMASPTGLAFDLGGNLWISDSSFSRVMEFLRLNDGQLAHSVLGQTSFTTSTCSTSQTGLCGPSGLTFDKSGNLWVADAHNNRVVRFSKPISTGGSESLVLGQTSFTASGCAATATGLCFPTATAFDSSGNLWVADSNNNRIVEYKAPFSNGESASTVLGQSGFTAKVCATSQSGLCGPSGIAFDKSGNLWVADVVNNRVLRFSAPFSNGEAASLVLGQTSFTTKASATTRGGLSFPISVSFDKSGNLWVADVGNDRVLRYSPSFTNGKLASIVIGQTGFTSTGCSTGSGLCNPEGVTFDPTGNLWVSDSVNGREISFMPQFYSGEYATTVIGQPNLLSSGCATSQSGLCNPGNIAFDKSGNFWVADFSNNRIMEFT